MNMLSDNVDSISSSNVEVYYKMPINELEELVYALQIDYNPPLLEDDRDWSIGEVMRIKDNAKFITEDDVHKSWRDKRIADGRNCHEKNTYLMQKDVDLVSDSQIVFLRDVLNSGEVIYYCFDRVDDVPELLKTGINPWTTVPFTEGQVQFLRDSQNSPYPNLSVGDFFEEVGDRLMGNGQVDIVEPQYKKYARQLEDMFTDIGGDLIPENVLTFASDLTADDYQLFLKHKPINQTLPEGISRTEASSTTLNFILQYINVRDQQGEGGLAKREISIAITEFVLKVKRNLTYNQLVEEVGQNYQGNGVKELYWKPDFVIEEYYHTGNIKRRYTVNEDDEKDGLDESWYENGNPRIKSTYVDSKKNGLDESWYENGNPRIKSTYVDGKKNGLDEEWYKNGNSMVKAMYMNGKIDGSYEGWYKNGNPMVKAMYVDGKIDGSYEGWYKNGNPKIKSLYVDKIIQYKEYIRGNITYKEVYENDIYNHTEFYHDGNKLRDETLYDDYDLVQGLNLYDDKDNLVLKVLYTDNETHESIFYGVDCMIIHTLEYGNIYRIIRIDTYENETIVSEEEYNEDGSSPRSKKFYENGEFIIEEYYYSNSDGSVSERHIYNNGELSTVDRYNENNVHKSREIHKNGKLNIVESYDKEGKVISRRLYDNSIHMSTKYYGKDDKLTSHDYYENDKLILTKFYDDDTLVGNETYYDDGSVEQKMLLKDGKVDIIEYYEEDDRISSREFYENDKPVLREYYHNDNGLINGRDFYKDGKITTSESYYNNNDLETRLYFKNNELDIEEFYENNIIVTRDYHENGDVLISEEYHHNGKVRERIFWMENYRIVDSYDDTDKLIKRDVF